MVSKIQFIINSRPLNVINFEDNFKIISPLSLIYGTRIQVFPQDIDTVEENPRLFEKVSNLDEQILAFENI